MIRRAQLTGPYKGHWIDWDPDAPWWLYERATEGEEDARAEFARAAILRWSFGPPPRESGDALPWDLEILIPRLFSDAHQLTNAEEGDILQRVWVGTSAVPIPELDRFRLCERLGIPAAPDFKGLRAGETLRLIRALNAWDEVTEQKQE